jgi:hypothetical protein
MNIENWLNDVLTGMLKYAERQLPMPITNKKLTDLKSRLCDRNKRLETNSISYGRDPQF